MQPQRESFSIRATKSRVVKGLLAIPKKHASLFPTTKSKIKIVFDDEEKTELKSYLPDDKKVKERRIFGLGRWFAKRDIKPGDRLTITVVDKQEGIYRLALDRYVRVRQQEKAWEALKCAPNDEAAVECLQSLAKITKRGFHRAAKEALLEIARESSDQRRSQLKVLGANKKETVAPAVRVLLRELHKGKCQICSFTFKKRSGDPYFEVHHVKPDVGDHPANLLVLCSNCHAQFEYAEVDQLERVGGWLIAVRINGKRLTLRQPLRTDPLVRVDSILWIFLISVHAGFTALSRWKS